MKKLSCILITFLTLNSFAGGWSSGGGELIKDSDNPWFLNNTTQINYCVLVDEENFGATPENIKHQIKRAISFWQRQFTEALLPNLSEFGPLKIASQTFNETSCNDQTSIKFQFGILDNQQKEYLKDPNQYAAVTVRTEYDEKKLKARGFIYVSPSKGPLAYTSERAISDAWLFDDGNLLYLTLLHELGHVFGLQHMGTLGDLMSEGFVESILLKHQRLAELPKATFPDFFSLRSSTPKICPHEIVLPNWQKFFEVDNTIQCFKFVFEHNEKNMIFGQSLMKIYAAPAKENSMSLVKEVQLAMYKFFPVFTSIIWLPSSQEIFSKKDLEQQVGPGILGVNGLSVSKKGKFRTNDGLGKRTISVQLQQGKATISVEGVMDGELTPLL